MATARPPLRYVRIVYAWIEDHRGHAKLRPAVVITDDRDIGPGAPIVVMAVTTTFPDPTPRDCVPLPWHPRSHPITRLNRRSAAVISWLSTIGVADVTGYGGDVPVKVMHQIESRLDELEE